MNFLETMRMYMNITINALLMLFFILAFNFIVLKGLFHLGQVWVFVISFLLIVIVAPFSSKLQLGNKIIDKYIEFIKGLSK